MADAVNTLGEALPLEIARVRDEVIPAYVEIGAPGQFALALIRQALDTASAAMISGDLPAMIVAYEALKGFHV